MSGFKDCFAVNGFTVDRSEGDGCIITCSGFEGEEELDFGFGDDGIDEDGAGLGVDDSFGGIVELFGVEFAQIDDLIFEGGAEAIEHFANDFVVAIALVLKLGKRWTFDFGAVGELAGEGCSGAVGIEKFVKGFLFGGGEADAGTGFWQIAGVG